MPKTTNQQIIDELNDALMEKTQLVDSYIKIIDQKEKRIQELVSAEEKTFLHSPTYLQMIAEINFLKNSRDLTEIRNESLEVRLRKSSETIKKLREDNSALMQSVTNEEYHIGISSSEPAETSLLKEEILELKGQLNAKTNSIKSRNLEIKRLQEEIASLKLLLHAPDNG
ncbi:MAG: hypothetical protein IJ733_19755 [Lachnospiraceae bacterium]|nr:hypothetical protein [Lachnospiraceae bacterium]